jgi:ribonuclease J
MRKNMNIARNLGYVDLPDDAIVSPKEAMDLPRDRVLVLCTGSQGEPMSALTRIAYGDHPNVTVERGDTVIISAKPVPGNELRVHDSINRLAQHGAEVLHQEIAPVHVSGHACSEEMRTLLSLVRPRAVMPIHGEYRMLAAHAQLARDAGLSDEQIVIAENGSVVELTPDGVRIADRIDAGVTLVDGLGVGDVEDVALRDRRRLSEDGVLIVVTTVAVDDGAGDIAPPELIARGVGEDEVLIDDLRAESARIVAELARNGVTEIKLVQEHIHDGIGQIVYERTRRRPMILPIVIEV